MGLSQAPSTIPNPESGQRLSSQGRDRHLSSMGGFLKWHLVGRKAARCSLPLHFQHTFRVETARTALTPSCPVSCTKNSAVFLSSLLPPNRNLSVSKLTCCLLSSACRLVQVGVWPSPGPVPLTEGA